MKAEILTVGSGLGLSNPVRRAAHIRSIAAGGRSASHQLVCLLRTWHERDRSRGELRLLDDYMLKDIGLSSTDAIREAAKPFWRR